MTNTEYRKRYKAEAEYNKMTEDFGTSARVYFMILGLAICHIDGEYLPTSYEITQHEMSEAVYKKACAILRTLYTAEAKSDYTRIRRAIQGTKNLTPAEREDLTEMLNERS